MFDVIRAAGQRFAPGEGLEEGRWVLLQASGICPLICLSHFPKIPPCYPQKETFLRAKKGREAVPWMAAAASLAFISRQEEKGEMGCPLLAFITVPCFQSARSGGGWERRVSGFVQPRYT